MDQPQNAAGAFQPLKWHQKLAYGVGHVFNDLCAAMWFCLFLVFLQYICKFPENLAGYLILFGQLVDGVCTPLVGYGCDHVSGFSRLGKRKTVYLFGSVAVLVTFPFIFTRCIGCSNVSSWHQFAYYSPFVVVFNVGYAAVQISHMALLNQITDDPSEETFLSGIRNAGTLFARIVVFSCAWFFFGEDKTMAWDHDDEIRFMTLMLIVIGFGSLCSTILLVVLKERNVRPSNVSINGTHSNQGSMLSLDWLREPNFWLVIGLFMPVRLLVNLSNTYWPLYVLNTLHMFKVYIVIVPMCVNVTGFCVSLLLHLLSDKIGLKTTLLIGCLLIICGCIWLYFIEMIPLLVLGPAILVGAGSSMGIVTTLTMTSDIIGVHHSTSAFVFGAMSLTDKVSTGLAVVFIQQYIPCPRLVICAKASGYYRMVMVFIVGGCACFPLLLLVITWPQKFGRLRKFPSSSSSGRNIKGTLV